VSDVFRSVYLWMSDPPIRFSTFLCITFTVMHNLSQDFRIIKIHLVFFRISDEMDTTDIEMD